MVGEGSPSDWEDRWLDAPSVCVEISKKREGSGTGGRDSEPGAEVIAGQAGGIRSGPQQRGEVARARR